MVRFSKQPDKDRFTVVGHTIMQGDGRVYIFIHEALKPFDTLVDLVLVHEATHLWNWQRGVGGADDECHRQGSLHHKKVLSILAKEPALC